MRTLAYFSMILFFVVMLTCGPAMINVPVHKPAQIDISGIRNIAVVDFNGPRESGSLASSVLTTTLVQNGFYKVFERDRIAQILQEHQLAQAGVVDESTARQVGQLLGVDALIFGQVISYDVEPDEVGTEKVEKKVGTGQYQIVTKGNKKVREEIKKTVIVDQEYRIRRGTVSVAFRTVNIETGQLLASKESTESYDSGKIVEGRGTLKPRDAILNDLLTTITRSFARMISPHVVDEKLALEGGKGHLKTGLQYAKNGLWREAQNSFEMSVAAEPSNPSAYYNLGLAFEVAGEFDKAEKCFQKAIALKNKDLYFRALANLKKFKAEQEKLRQQLENQK